MDADPRSCVVLVTGGAGCLGQHIVGLLQARAHHVTEIRILDIVTYANKLDYPDNKPVRQFTGSVLDVDLVLEACRGVDSVLHIATVIDISLFPDEKRSYDINVVGTRNIINACKAMGVKRLINCSSTAVVIDMDDIFDGAEDLPYVSKSVFGIYGDTKAKAEQAVVAANGDHDLVTTSIRPTLMYGEQDWNYIGRVIWLFKRFGRRLRVDCGSSKQTHVYVGNVAWCFVCAENTLHEDTARAERIGGQVFFVGDGSLLTDESSFQDIFLNPIGIRTFPVAIPFWIMKAVFYILVWLFSFVSLFHNVNVSFNITNLQYLTRARTFSYEKARKLLNYKPLYTFEQATARSMTFYSNI